MGVGSSLRILDKILLFLTPGLSHLLTGTLCVEYLTYGYMDPQLCKSPDPPYRGPGSG